MENEPMVGETRGWCERASALARDARVVPETPWTTTSSSSKPLAGALFPLKKGE